MSLTRRFQEWRAAAPNFRARKVKQIRQLAAGWHRPQQLSFVFGCQRSGTKMLMRILDESPEINIFHENNPLAFRDFELRSNAVLRALAASSPARCQVFKPICDSHRAARVLSDFPAARGVWIYRLPGDVARSAVQKWAGHQREVIQAIASGDLQRWGWRTADLPEAVVETVKAVCRPDLTEYEGALLFWWIRNSFYFSQGLEAHPRMRLVRYEHLVTEPESRFPEVFSFVGAAFETRFIARVHGKSLRGESASEASPEIRALCDTLLERLDARAVAADPPPIVSPVLMLIDSLGIGGAERYVVTVSNAMASAGAELCVAAQAGGFEADLAPEVRHVDLPMDRVRAGIPVIGARVARLIHGRPPAAIVAHSAATTGIARIATVGTHIPVLTVAHGWPDSRYSKVIPLLRAADRVVAVSPDVREKLLREGLPPDRCVVVQNGVDCAPFHPRTGEAREAARASMGAGPEDLLVFVVGRLTPQKAHHHVVSIADRLRESHPRLRFALAGDGARAEELAGLIRDAGLQDRVRLLGLRRDLPELLGSADLYLSCSDWEGMSLAMIEAMASGLPCVSTRTEGTALLLDETCGLVAPVGDVVGLADALAKLAGDPALRARMGDAARTRALDRFSHERVARELMAILDDLTHPGRNRSQEG
jgi:glycosyltransferase involved in cell wall biosynthesis